MVEAAQSYTRGNVGHKSIALKQRQKGCPSEVIAYADRGNERLRRRFYRMTLNKGINRNVAVTAIARELACFMWGWKQGIFGEMIFNCFSQGCCAPPCGKACDRTS